MKILLHFFLLHFAVSNIRVSFFNFPYNYKNRVLACFQTRPGKTLPNYFPRQIVKGGQVQPPERTEIAEMAGMAKGREDR